MFCNDTTLTNLDQHSSMFHKDEDKRIQSMETSFNNFKTNMNYSCNNVDKGSFTSPRRMLTQNQSQRISHINDAVGKQMIQDETVKLAVKKKQKHQGINDIKLKSEHFSRASSIEDMEAKNTLAVERHDQDQ